jgi:hypothetical protein
MSTARVLLWERADKQARVEVDFRVGLIIFSMYEPGRMLPITSHCAIECATAIVVTSLLDQIALQTPAVPGVSASDQGAEIPHSAPASQIAFDSGSVPVITTRHGHQETGPLSVSEIMKECAG